MRIDDACIPCLVNQSLKILRMTGSPNREDCLREIFTCLSRVDWNRTAPEIGGEVFRVLTRFTGNPDPFREIRSQCNRQMLALKDSFAMNSLEEGIRIAIAGNVIDFSPAQSGDSSELTAQVARVAAQPLAVNRVKELEQDLAGAENLLYVLDNCGEIVLDGLLMGYLRQRFPKLQITAAVRGEPVVNDVTLQDAEEAGLSRYARVITNGDYIQGTLPSRSGEEFRRCWQQADVVLCKGQANLECMDREEKNLYFLLMAKCPHIARCAGVKPGSLVCMKREDIREG